MSEADKELVKQQFSKTAEQYVTSEIHAKGEDLSLLVQWINPSVEWIALDIATGAGHTAKALCPYVQHVIAADLTSRMLTVAASHLQSAGCKNVSFVIADAESMPFIDNSFHVVTCRIAPHHFPNPDRFVREVARVLRPGGLFLLIDNVAPIDEDLAVFMNTVEKLRDESHVRCPSVYEWLGWLKESQLMEQKSRMRKKTYHFPDWVERASISPQQADVLERFVLEASRNEYDYFSVVTEKGRVVSLQVDEWMVLCKKM